MSLIKTIQKLVDNVPSNEALLTSLTLQLTLEQFKNFAKEVNEEYKDFQPKLIDWSTYDVTKPIKYIILGGRTLIINII
jgi:hypothetical protein